jgi:N-acetylated-alpha-linked acidic dipeptidase
MKFPSWIMGPAVLALVATPVLRSQTMTGFKQASAEAELKAEKAFDAAIDPAEMKGWLEQMSSEPNQVGSPHDKANAEFMLAKFTEWGWDAHIETFSVLYPTPVSETLEMVSPVAFKASLTEKPIEGDRTSGKSAGALPPYLIYSGDGDVTAELVYVNYGMPEDYALLARMGIDVSGKIVIARYGAGWRGLKPKLAEEHGAVGCIIYSDPHEDGYFQGDAYPKGGFRPDDGVQRGSVADITIQSGDPLTPGYGATEDAKRIPIADSKLIRHIPALPISYGDARPLLEALGGPVAPATWRGALPVTYHVGAGPAKVHLAVKSDWSLKPVYDVIAVMRGSTFPNQWVIRGNHHDGWVFGAFDPLAGNVAVMEEAKAIGTLAKSGWAPKRTLVYASWDGEEPGLLGSTEWAETHADELQRKAVLYVNSDTNGRGIVGVGGSPSCERLVNEVLASVPDPETGVSVRDRARAAVLVAGLEAHSSDPDDEFELKAARDSDADLPLSPLGSGSDYTPFLQHLGIASLNIGFFGEGQNGGVYHSLYDSYDHFMRFGDPKFQYDPALAKAAGRLVLRTADADVIPMHLAPVAAAAERYVGEIERLVGSQRERAIEVNNLITAGAFKLAADPEAPRAAPQRVSVPPAIQLGSLVKAAARFKRSAVAFDGALAKLEAQDLPMASGSISIVNSALQGMEQALTNHRGLPGRPWYQHMLFAPGLFQGYGAKTMPAVRESIELGHWDEANEYIGVVAATLEAAASKIDQATAVLAPAKDTRAPATRGASVPPPPDS